MFVKQCSDVPRWMNACTAGGALTWPHGSAYESAARNNSDEATACGGPAITSAYASSRAPTNAELGFRYCGPRAVTTMDDAYLDG